MTLIIRADNKNIKQFDAYLDRKAQKTNTFIVNFPVDPKDSQLLVGACRHNLFKAVRDCTAPKIKVIVIPGHGAQDSPRVSYQAESSASFDIGGLAQLVKTIIGDRLLQVKIYSCYSGNGPNCLAARFSQYVSVPVVGFHSCIRVVRGGHVPVPETPSIRTCFEDLKNIFIRRIPWEDDGFDYSMPLDRYEEHMQALVLSARKFYNTEIREDKRVFFKAKRIGIAI